MTKNKSECIDAARKALNLYTGQELEQYIKDVNLKTKELQAKGIPFARDAAMKEINKTHLQELLDDSARAARNMGKYDTIKSKMNADIKERAFLEKTNKNTDYNIETANKAAQQTLSTQAFGKLSKEHLDVLEDGNLDDAIYAVADGGKHENSIAQQIGESLKEYIDPRNAMLIRSDAMRPSEMSEDRFFRNMYNQSALVKLGKENWVAMHKSLIDIKKTFANTKAMNIDGEIDDLIVDEIIGNTFDNIIEGNGPLFTKASVSRDREAVERTRHMFYKYKDWKSWGIANKTYGQGTLMTSWMQDINTSGNQVGLAEIFGSSPQSMWLSMRDIAVAKEENTNFNSIKRQQNDALFNNLLGVNKGAYKASIADIGTGVRALTSMARLGGIVLRSIPDISNIAGFAQRAGAGYWRPYFNAITNAFNLMPDESRRILARTASHSLNIHAGTTSKYIDVSGMGNIINRMSNKFFSRIALNAYDKGNKLSAMDPIMKGFGKSSEKGFEALNEQQKSYLSRFNISPIEWDALRSKTEKRLFSTDNVTSMTESEIKDLWKDGDKIIPLSEYGSSLYRKVFAMFDAAHEFSVLNPTAYTNMIITGNTRAGTIGGEAMRSIFQFKAYPIQYFRRVWVGGMQDFDSYQAKMMYALNMSLGTMMLSGLSEVLVSLSKGLTPPDPTKMSKGEAAQYYIKLLGGGLGVFSTILNDKTTSKSITQAAVLTPSIKLLVDPFVTALSLAHGDLKGAKNAAREWANVANPVGTIPGISPFIDSFLGNKPYVEPGQRSLF